METYKLVLQVLLLICSIPLQFLLGFYILKRLIPSLIRFFKFEASDILDSIREYEDTFVISLVLVFGLVFHLAISFLLKVLGLGWYLAYLIPLLPSIFTFKQAFNFAKSLKIELRLSFLLWVSFHLLLALSIFSVSHEVTTIWKNNFGDLTWHIGIILSFIKRDNFPPDMPIYAGYQLGYPVLVNYWTALNSFLVPNLHFLKFVFVFQWILLWSILYFILRGDKKILLPWLVIFAGGTYFTISTYSFKYALEGFPWALILPTIWINQRTAMLGAVVLLTAIVLFQKLREKDLTLAACPAIILLAMGILCHVHMLLVGLMFIAFSILSEFILRLNKTIIRQVILYFICLSPVLCFYFFITSKSGIIKPIFGWTLTGKNPIDFFRSELNKDLDIISQIKIFIKYFSQGLSSAFVLWLQNAWQVFVFALILLYSKSNRKNLTSLLLIFIIGNFLQFSFWEWDNIKYYLACYLVLIALAVNIDLSKLRLKFLIVSQVLLIFPGVYETASVFIKSEKVIIYAKQHLDLAEAINQLTEDTAVIAANPEGRSPVMLGARRLYHGNPGILGTQGINSRKDGRREIQDDFNKIITCKSKKLAVMCPDYFLWRVEEQNYWKLKEIPKSDLIEPTQNKYLYKIK